MKYMRNRAAVLVAFLSLFICHHPSLAVVVGMAEMTERLLSVGYIPYVVTCARLRDDLDRLSNIRDIFIETGIVSEGSRTEVENIATYYELGQMISWDDPITTLDEIIASLEGLSGLLRCELYLPVAG